MLGFSDRIARGDTLSLYENYCDLADSLARLRTATYGSWVPRQLADDPVDIPGLLQNLADGKPVQWVPGAQLRENDELDSLHFSDTLMFWSDDGTLSNGDFIDRIIDFFCQALEMGLPLRGAIARGDLIHDPQRSIVIGPVLVEAAKAESAQAWCGLGLGPSFKGQVIAAPDDRTLAFKGHIKPGRESEVLPVAVDWTWHWRARNPKLDIESLAARFGNHRYWEPTIEFARRSRAAGDRGYMPIFDLEIGRDDARGDKSIG